LQTFSRKKLPFRRSFTEKIRAKIPKGKLDTKKLVSEGKSNGVHPLRRIPSEKMENSPSSRKIF
jgi:hypothetical protein